MHRRHRVRVLLVAVTLASTLALSACGATDPPADAAAFVADAHTSQAVDRADAPTTTTTVAPTTTVPPTTTTAAPPPTTARKPAATTAPAPTKRTTVVVTAPPAPPSAAASSCTDAGLLSSINSQRAQSGLRALTLRGGATTVACSWSAHMTTSGLAHNGNLSGDLAAHGVTGWKAMGENVGYGGSAGQVFSAFMASSGHRANILNAKYSQVGIGVVRSGSRVWVTFDFVGY